MRKSRFSESQIRDILKEAEGGICRRCAQEAGDRRKHIFQVAQQDTAVATVAEVKRLRELEAENAKLKRMYADFALENAAIKDVLNRKL